jgi:hypothetical protein
VLSGGSVTAAKVHATPFFWQAEHGWVILQALLLCIHSSQARLDVEERFCRLPVQVFSCRFNTSDRWNEALQRWHE